MNPKRKSILRLVVVLLLVAGPPAALLFRGEERVDAADAARHVDEEKSVCGEVAATRYAHWIRGEPTFLNFGRPHPEQVFTAVIWGDDRGRFEGRPEVAYRGRRICVTGRIELHRGTPQIEVEGPGQVEVLEDEER